MTGRASVLVGLLIGGAFYLLLIDTVQLPELYAGAGAVLLAGIAFEISREQGFTEASFSLRWFARSWRVLWRVPVAIALVSWEALAQLVFRGPSRGRFVAISFKAPSDDPRDVGRRALAEALGSMTPNTIVIGVDPERQLLLVHQLYRQDGREELDVLGLG